LSSFGVISDRAQTFGCSLGGFPDIRLRANPLEATLRVMRQRWISYWAAAGALASLIVLVTVGFAVLLVKIAIAVFAALLIFLAAKLRK
jgi:hypothetical protein